MPAVARRKDEMTRSNFINWITPSGPRVHPSLFAHNMEMYKCFLKELNNQETGKLLGKIPAEVVSLVFLHLAQNIGNVHFQISATNKLFNSLFQIIRQKCRSFVVNFGGLDAIEMTERFKRLNRIVDHLTFIKCINLRCIDLYSHQVNFSVLLDSWKHLAATLNKSVASIEFDHCTMGKGWMYIHPRRYQVMVIRCPSFNDCDLFLLFMHDYTHAANQMRRLKGFALIGTSVRFEFLDLVNFDQLFGRRRFFTNTLAYIARSLSFYETVIFQGNRILQHKGKTGGFWGFLAAVEYVNSELQNSERPVLKDLFSRPRTWHFQEEGMLFHNRCKSEWEAVMTYMQEYKIRCVVSGLTKFQHLAFVQRKKWPVFIPRWHRGGTTNNNAYFDYARYCVLDGVEQYLHSRSIFL